MRARPHHHACQHCQAKTECCGDVEQNYDGWPEWICREYHALIGSDFQQNESFLCDRCAELKELGTCDDCGAWATEPHDANCSIAQQVDECLSQ